MNAPTASPTTAGVWILRSIIAIIALAVVGGIGFAVITSIATPSGLSELTLTHVVSRGDLNVTVTEDGTLESSSNKEIKCKVKGGSTVLWVIETGTQVQPGDVLVELDTANIEDQITQQQIAYENALANKIISESNVAVARTSITEYLQGTYLDERSTIEKEIFDAEEAVKIAQLGLQSAERLAAKGVLRSLQLEGQRFSLDSARKELELKRTRLEALDKYTKEKTVQELESALQAAEARLASDIAALNLEQTRLSRANEQLENCTIRSEVAGMVIFPSAAEWKEQPDIEEGATVREQQTLLIIPDLNQMQVKVGIHESKIDRMQVGMKAKIQLQDRILEGKISDIATVTRPAGWWTGNMVKYDTMIKLDSAYSLKPGMSAVVDVYLAEHKDVITIPVAAITQTEQGSFCWVVNGDRVERRALQLSDSNDQFMVVEAGLEAGETVVLNPRTYIDEAKAEGLLPPGSSTPERGSEKKSADIASTKLAGEKPGTPKANSEKANSEKRSSEKPGGKTPDKPKTNAEKQSKLAKTNVD